MDFAFLNYIEHKAEQIIGFYGKKEHKGKGQCLAGKRRLNCVFEAMDLCYVDRDGPSKDVAPHGRGARWR